MSEQTSENPERWWNALRTGLDGNEKGINCVINGIVTGISGNFLNKIVFPTFISLLVSKKTSF